jgi:hypothetical protein
VNDENDFFWTSADTFSYLFSEVQSRDVNPKTPVRKTSKVNCAKLEK